MFFKKLLATALVLYSTSVFAVITNRDVEVPIPMGKACIVKVSTVQWINANAISYVEVGDDLPVNTGWKVLRKSGVRWYFGKHYVSVLTDDPTTYLNSVFKEIEKCK